MRKSSGGGHHREVSTLPAEIAAQIAVFAEAAHEPLTFRETEILCWIARGKSDWEIGEILQISSKTVNFHVENAKRKFGVPTRIQAVLLAVWTGSDPAIRPRVTSDAPAITTATPTAANALAITALSLQVFGAHV